MELTSESLLSPVIQLLGRRLEDAHGILIITLMIGTRQHQPPPAHRYKRPYLSGSDYTLCRWSQQLLLVIRAINNPFNGIVGFSLFHTFNSLISLIPHFEIRTCSMMVSYMSYMSQIIIWFMNTNTGLSRPHPPFSRQFPVEFLKYAWTLYVHEGSKMVRWQNIC